jgi:CheY-like chemotaxis protein
MILISTDPTHERTRPVARILIADDHADVRDLLVALFRLRRHDATAFATGPALLADLRARPADLCLVDWMMPGMDGPSVLSAIRADPDPRVAATPVVMLTSDDRADHRYLARHAGAQAFINKATPVARLFEAVAPYLPATPRAPDHAETPVAEVAPAIRQESNAREEKTG